MDPNLRIQAQTILDALRRSSPGAWDTLESKVNLLRFLQISPGKIEDTLYSELLDATRMVLKCPYEELTNLLQCTEAQLREKLSWHLPEEKWPETGWIADYLHYTRWQESPSLFHFWCAVAVIGAALRRDTYFDKGFYKVVPNHYVVLVAPAGRCRRSVATRIAIDLLRASESTLIITEKATPEALVEVLEFGGTHEKESGRNLIKQDACGIVHAPELSVFLGRQTYNEGLIAILTTLYDSPDHWEYLTRTKGKVKLQNVALSILGASAPDWLADSLPAVAFGGGFMSRIIFCYLEDTDRVVAFPKSDPSEREMLVGGLRGIADCNGPVLMTREALQWYEEWYIRTKDVIPEDMKLSGYYERKQDHLIRLAICLNVAAGRGLEMNEVVLQDALRYLERIEPSLPAAFRQIGATSLGRDHERMLSQLMRAGGRIEMRSWIRMNTSWMDKRRFIQAVDTLLGAGHIEKIEDGPRTFFVAKKRLD